MRSSGFSDRRGVTLIDVEERLERLDVGRLAFRERFGGSEEAFVNRVSSR